MTEQDSIQVGGAQLLDWLETPACLLALPDTILAANQALADLLQSTPGALCGLRLHNLLLDEVDMIAAQLQYIAQTGPRAPQPARIRAADGRALPVMLKPLAGCDPAQRLLALTPLNPELRTRLNEIKRGMLEYQAIMANAPVGIGFSRNRQIIRYNEKFAEIFGFTGNNGIGQPTTVLYPSEQAFFELSQRAFPLLSQGLPFEEEMLMRRQDGAEFWAHAVAYLVDTGDPPQGTIWIITDIDKRKAAENLQRDTMLQLQSIVDSAAIGIFFSQDRQFKRCNRRGEIIFGYEPGELLGRPGISIYPSVDSYEQLGRAAGPLLAAGEAFRGDWQYRRKDGTLIWCRVYAKAIDPAHTERGTVWIFDDVSEARAMQEALTQSLQQMEALMRNASVGILITQNKIMTRYNPMFGQMFDFNGETGLGRPAAILFRSEDEYSALGTLAAPLLSQAKPFQSELYMRRQDGSDLWVNLIGYVADPQAPHRATFWILEDRSAFKQAETALLRAQRDLAQAEKLAALGALVVGVAHELNTPLGNALTAATTLQERSQEIQVAIGAGALRRSQLNSFLGDMASLSGLVSLSCERAAQLVASFKQVAVGRRNEQRARFRLDRVLEQVLTMHSEQQTEPGKYQIICERVPAVECDSYPEALTELLVNVLENAVTHAFVGRPAGVVRISVSAADWIEIRVADDGIGMDALTLTRIFDPYFTTRLGYGRSGLGLPIARNLASAILGGEMSVESQPGQGACFILRFPRCAAAEQAPAVAKNA